MNLNPHPFKNKKGAAPKGRFVSDKWSVGSSKRCELGIDSGTGFGVEVMLRSPNLLRMTPSMIEMSWYWAEVVLVLDVAILGK